MSKRIKTDNETLNTLRDMAEQGDVEAQFRLAQCLSEGRGQGIDSNEEESLKWLRKAAEQGYGYAQVLLAKRLSDNWNEENDEATEWMYKAANGASGEAQYELGRYLLSRKYAGDDQKALKLFKKAAKQNNADAQCILGMAYLYGAGLEKDTEKGMELLRKAAEQGYEPARRKLELLYSPCEDEEAKGEQLMNDPDSDPSLSKDQQCEAAKQSEATE